MPIYEYQGQQFDIETNDPVLAKQKILSYVNKEPEESSILKDIVGEVASIGKVVAGAPEFLAGAIGTPVQAVGQVLGNAVARATTGNTEIPLVDWEKASTDAKRIASPFKSLTEPVEKAIDYFGIRDNFNNAKITKGLEAVSKGVDWVGEEVEKKTGIPKAATVASLDIGMLGVGVPGIKPLYRAIEKRVAPDVVVSSSKPIVDSKGTSVVDTPSTPVVAVRPDADLYLRETLEVPQVSKDLKEFDNSLYNLNNIPKLDTTEVINTDKALKDSGVTLELQEKFRRFDEGQAKGNELINNQVTEINKKINETYSENAAYFKEGNYKSKENPQGSSTWRDFEFKEEVRLRYEIIKELESQKAALEAKRTDREVLTPAEKEIYQRYYEPVKTEIARLSEYLEKEGVIKPFGKDVDFASRKTAPKTNVEKGVLQTYKEAIIGRDFTEQRRDVNNTADAGKDRIYFALEDSRGKREVVSIVEGEKFNSIYPIRNGVQGKPIQVPKEMSLLTGEKVLGKTVREASVAELELNTGRNFAKDYNLVLGERLTELREQARIYDWSKDLLANPEMIARGKVPNGTKLDTVGWVAKDKFDTIPEGFRQLRYTDKTPLLRDVYFENRYAEMLDDFNKPIETGVMAKINNTLVTNMMLVPIAHMHNELFHFGLTQGVSGIARVPTIFKGLVDATKEVISRGEFYKEILREGGSVMSANVRNTYYLDQAYKQSLDTLAKDKSFKDLAKAVAVKPAELYKSISMASNRSMWTVRDVLYTQLIKQKMDQGKTMKQAIDSVERHMPNYRLPSRLITQKQIGRNISQALNNRNIFLFSRYHAGMVGSVKNTIKDLAMLDPVVKKSTQFKEGLDSAIGAGVALAVLYPLLDQLAQVVAETLDFDGLIDDAKLRRAGAAHVFDTISEIAANEKDAYSLSSILITPSPVLQVLVETLMNKELYNSKQVMALGADVDVVADQYLQYLTRKIPQASQAMQATNEDYGTGVGGIVLRNFFDIKAKSEEQNERVEDQVTRREKELEKLDEDYEGLFFRRP